MTVSSAVDATGPLAPIVCADHTLSALVSKNVTIALGLTSQVCYDKACKVGGPRVQLLAPPENQPQVAKGAE